jgi:hypothetical protein
LFFGGDELSVERNLLVSFLKLTQNGAVELDLLKNDAKIPLSTTSLLLHKLQKENLIKVNGRLAIVDTDNRIKLAVKAVQLGADLEQISHFLGWQEFEAMAAMALELNGYATKKNARFKHEEKRWEIDVVGCRKPLVLCVDCKHWHHSMVPSTLSKMAQVQSKRADALSKSLPIKNLRLPCAEWSRAKFVPIILSLVPFNPKYSNGIPVVPVLQLQDFVSQLPLNVESLLNFTREFSHL